MGERGQLIALEGIDGCGKSTQVRLLADALGSASVVVTSEPGATTLGASLRALLLDAPALCVTPRAEALLMAADRAQHVAQVVAPALDAGCWVISDRFSASTLAYQGYGRGLDLNELRQLVGWASGGLIADVSVLIDVPPPLARARLGAHGPDRLERLDEAFHARVRDGYLALAEADPNRWIVVEGERAVADVAADIFSAVTARLGKPPVTS